MDKLNIKRRVLIFNIFCFLAIAVFVAGLNFSTNVGFAADLPEPTVTAVIDADLTDGEITYIRENYSGNYSKDVEITFDLASASYYKIDVTVDGVLIEGTKTAAPAEGKALYKVSQSGVVTVTLYAYDDSGELAGSISKTVKSDNVAPEVPTYTGMDRYYKTGSVYNVNINLNEVSDLHSGRGNIYYSLSTDKSSLIEVTNSDAVTLSISDKTTVYLYVFDNAKNCVVEEYVFDKFDETSPAKPEITVTPISDLTKTNGFTRGYEVEINYGFDAESGIKNRYYFVNDARHEYNGAFTLERAAEYTIRAYSADVCGNISEETAVKITAAAFDNDAPSIINATAIYDLMQEKPVKLRVEARDTQSGIKEIAAAGGEVFNELSEGVYELYFDCYGVSSVVINATDKVGNVSFRHVAFNYFNDKDFSDKLKSYSASYFNADFSEYTENAVEKINAAFAKLNVLVSSDLTASEDFDNCFKEIDELMSGKSSFSYVIEKAPTYLSGALTYTVNDGDFDGYKKGDEIKLTFASVGNANDFLKKSGFDKGFSENFTLNVFYNGELQKSLSNGLKISMNMPVGFYERSYALFNADTGEKVEITLINNKIEFTLAESGNYSLVISGASTPTTNVSASKGVTVFGHKLSLTAFLGTVIGGAVVAVAGIAVVIIIFKRKGR